MFASINHNLLASNTARNLNEHYSKLVTSTRRLSTGLRVGCSADDAAGLAIRELMRADIAAVQQGVRNANDAISMIQVADGALSIIDEKLIRMKELAEQAATGTYDSTQRLMIDSEFQAMGAEIDRIARATEFNGIHLLDGSLSGAHDGNKLNATGKMKVHFGTGNDSAEDYYYIEIGDCTTNGLGLKYNNVEDIENKPDHSITPLITLNDFDKLSVVDIKMPQDGSMLTFEQIFDTQGKLILGKHWTGSLEDNYCFKIPKGTKNIIINSNGGAFFPDTPYTGHNAIQLLTTNGDHLVGSPEGDWVYRLPGKSVGENMSKLGLSNYNRDNINLGPANYDGLSLNYSEFNGMKIGFSGDPDQYETGSSYNDGYAQIYPDYQVITISEATEDLIVWYIGDVNGYIKAYWDVPDDIIGPPLNLNSNSNFKITTIQNRKEDSIDGESFISIKTQDEAQRALITIDNAIITKDKIRAHLGALQNRLENTVSNLSIQAENLQASESRISDVDVATEMTEFVRSQILTQSAVAMLSQANSIPNLAMSLLHN